MDIWNQMERTKANRAKAMPTEADAMRQIHDARLRLEDLGWKSAIYCPKDGSPFLGYEASGLKPLVTHYIGEWPDGRYLAEIDGDLWPCNPILFKPMEEENGR